MYETEALLKIHCLIDTTTWESRVYIVHNETLTFDVNSQSLNIEPTYYLISLSPIYRGCIWRCAVRQKVAFYGKKENFLALFWCSPLRAEVCVFLVRMDLYLMEYQI